MHQQQHAVHARTPQAQSAHDMQKSPHAVHTVVEDHLLGEPVRALDVGDRKVGRLAERELDGRRPRERDADAVEHAAARRHRVVLVAVVSRCCCGVVLGVVCLCVLDVVLGVVCCCVVAWVCVVWVLLCACFGGCVLCCVFGQAGRQASRRSKAKQRKQKRKKRARAGRTHVPRAKSVRLSERPFGWIDTRSTGSMRPCLSRSTAATSATPASLAANASTGRRLDDGRAGRSSPCVKRSTPA